MFLRGATHSVRTSYSFKASLITFTSSNLTYPSLPVYFSVDDEDEEEDSRLRTASSQSTRRESLSNARNPTHHPSKRTNLIFPCLFSFPSVSEGREEEGELTTPHSSTGHRSPSPLNKDLSYAGMRVSLPSRREQNTSLPKATSCVEGCPRC